MGEDIFGQIRAQRPGDVAFLGADGAWSVEGHPLRLDKTGTIYMPIGKVLIGDLGVLSGASASTLIVATTKATSWVMADFSFTNTGNGTDSGAARFLAATGNTGSSSAVRAAEFHVFRLAGASAGNTWPLELGIHSDVAGNGVSQNTAIYALSTHAGWPQTPTGSRADYAIVVGGEDGWTGLLYYVDTNGSTVLFKVGQTGAITAKGTHTWSDYGAGMLKTDSSGVMSADSMAWTTPAFSAGNFIASGAGTWTVAAGDVVTYKYMLMGKTMFIAWSLNATTVAQNGADPTALQITIPASKTAASAFINPCYALDNNVRVSAYASVAASGTQIQIFRQDAAQWANATDTTYVFGQIVIETT